MPYRLTIAIHHEFLLLINLRKKMGPPSPSRRLLSKRSERTLQDDAEFKRVMIASLRDGAYSESNKNGVISLCVAENKLSSDIIAERLSRVPDIPCEFLGYSGTCYDAMANFLSRFVTKQPVSAQDIYIGGGATGTIDDLIFAICDADDKVILTAPGYQGFESCLCSRNGVKLEFAQLDEAKEFRVDIDALEKTWQNAGGSSSRIRALLLSTPGNPTGEVLAADTIREIVAWTRARGIHAIFDEIYALSVFAEGSKFVSVAEVLDNQLGDDVHIIWAVSKDFSASGLRAGVIISHSADLLKRLKKLYFIGGLSSLTGWALIDILSDTKWVESYITENKRRLAKAYTRITTLLEADRVPYVRAQAGFFLILDLRAYLQGPVCRASEMDLFKKMADAGVLLTPCCEAFSIKYGYFRLVYGAASEEVVEVAWSRLKNVLRLLP